MMLVRQSFIRWENAKLFFSGFPAFAACLCFAFQAFADIPRYATPEAVLEALAVACERTNHDYDDFKYSVNVVAVSDILSSRRILDARPADPKFAFSDSNFFQNQFYQSAQTGKISQYNFPDAYIRYPWRAKALRGAGLAAVGKDVSIARIVNDQGQTAYFVLRDHTPNSWRVVAIANSEEQARYYAKDEFWNAYVAAKAAQLREWTKRYEEREALAAKLYSEVHLKETAFETESRPNGDQVLQFSLTITNDSDYVLEYADGSLRLKDEAGKYNFGASFSTKEAKNPVFAHSSAPYDVVIVFNRLREMGGPELVAHYRAGLGLLEAGEIPYEATLVFARMVKGSDAIGINRFGASPRQSRNPDIRPDYEFLNQEIPPPPDDAP